MRSMLRSAWAFVGSKSLSVWMVAAWLFYYVSLTVWSKEAFAGFAGRLEKSLLFQGLFLIMLINLFARLIGFVRNAERRFALGFLGTGSMFLGVFLVLLGFFTSTTSRHIIQTLVGAEHTLVTPWDGKRYTVKSVVPSLKEYVLDIDTEGGVFRMEPRVILETGGRETTVGAFPPARIGRTHAHVLQTGLAPGIRIARDNRVMREGYAALRVLPPPSVDMWKPEDLPYGFLFKLAPDEEIMKGRLKVGRFSLVEPLYDIRVTRGREEIARGVSDDEIIFNGFTLSVFDTDYWAFIEVVRDDGIPLVASGLVLLALGLILMLMRWFGLLLRLIL